MSPRQRQVFDALLAYVKEHGKPPVASVIGERVGMEKKNVGAVLAALRRSGHVIHNGETRSLHVRYWPTDMAPDWLVARIRIADPSSFDAHADRLDEAHELNELDLGARLRISAYGGLDA